MRGLAFVLALAATAPASAGWRRVDSPNFIVVGDVSVRELRSTATKFEGFHEALRRVLPAGVASAPVPTLVVVFPTDEAFTPFKPRYQGKPRAVSGYAGSGVNLNVIAMESRLGEYSDRVIFHEYTHIVIANGVALTPPWLNEGLAEYYSTFALIDGGRRAQLGRPIAEHLRTLNGSIRIPLGALLKVDRSSPLYNEDNHAGDFYAESWALTHMLLNGQPPRVSELSDYLSRVNQGAAEEQAWQAVFGTDRVENDLRQYMRRPVFSFVQIDFMEKVAALPAADVAFSAADTAAVEAMLQIRNGARDEAAALLDPALKQEPASALANVAMAQLDLARQNSLAAERRLMAMNPPSDWLSAYLGAVTLLDAAQMDRGVAVTDGVLPRAARMLETVRERQPDLPNVLASLARVELAGDASPTPAAQQNIARARALAPGRIDYALTQAQLFATMRDFARARAVVGPLMTPAYPESVRDAARRLMGGLVALEKESTGAGPSGASRSVPVPDADAGRPRASRSEARFVPAYRALQAGEQRLEGSLERIACAPGKPATLSVRAGDGTVEFEGRLADIDFIAYRNDLTGGVTCGPRDPMRVYVTWREGPSPRHEKVAVAVEFLPKD